MADPVTMGTMAVVGMGATALGGVASAAGAQVTAEGKKVDIEGQMLATVGKAYGFQVQAEQQTYQSDVETYQAGVSEVNRQIAEGNASYARDVGEVSASQEGMKDRVQVSTAKVAQGASGVDVNTGSAVNVRESMIELGQYNQAVIRANAAKVAYNYDVQATQDAAQRDLHLYGSAQDKVQAANDMTAAGLTMEAIPLQQQAFALAGEAGDISSAGSLLSAAGSVASKWSTFKST